MNTVFSAEKLTQLAGDLARVAERYVTAGVGDVTLFMVDGVKNSRPTVDVYARDQQGREWLLVRVAITEPVKFSNHLNLKLDLTKS